MHHGKTLGELIREKLSEGATTMRLPRNLRCHDAAPERCPEFDLRPFAQIVSAIRADFACHDGTRTITYNAPMGGAVVVPQRTCQYSHLLEDDYCALY